MTSSYSLIDITIQLMCYFTCICTYSDLLIYDTINGLYINR